MFRVAVLVAETLQEVIGKHDRSGQSADSAFSATLILGGQIAGGPPRLFLIYPEGNFIEAGADTPFFQIGEMKYGRPILVRAYNRSMSFEEAVKLLLVSFDSTLKANLTVGAPLDFYLYEADSLKPGRAGRIGQEDPYFQVISSNWGDALNPWLIQEISGLPVRFEANPKCPKLFAIGSILHHADGRSIVWGSGMISENAVPRESPQKILAVRGPLTRHQLQRVGIEVPEIYGDPALLLPRFLPGERQSQWAWGLVPHYTDRNHPLVDSFRGRDDVRIIDVRSATEDFVRELTACEKILSSSLHGLICADAYGIPNRRLLLHEKLTGGDFKFLDYYGAMHCRPELPVGASELSHARHPGKLATRFIEGFDPEPLLDAFPKLYCEDSN